MIFCSVAVISNVNKKAQAEEITLTTYYPAPRGDYDELNARWIETETFTVGTGGNAASVNGVASFLGLASDPAADVAEGDIYYNNQEHVFKYRNDQEWVAMGGGGVPTGSMLPYGGTTAPSGWLLCDGAEVSRSDYASLFAAIGTSFGSGDGSTTFNLPDLRGEFLRGWDNSRGRDPDAATRTGGDAVGSTQEDEFMSHTHTTSAGYSNNKGRVGSDNRHLVFSGHTTGATGGNETRPKNVAVNFIIKD